MAVPMTAVVIGKQADIAAFRAVIDEAADSVRYVCLDELAADIPLEVQFDSILAADDVSRVVVLSDGPAAAIAVRRAAQGGLPALFPVPIETPVAAHYELTVVAEETGARLSPFWPRLSDPCLPGLLGDGPRSEQRWTSAEATVGVPLGDDLLTAADSLQAFAVLERAGFQPGQVHVVELGPDHLLAVLECSGGRTARIELTRAPEAHFSLKLNDGFSSQWSWSAQGGCRFLCAGSLEKTAQDHTSVWLAERTLRFFLRGGEVNEAADWSEAVAAIQVADAAVESRQRRRAVPVVRALASRETVFRATMAIWGCGLLWLVVLMLPLIGLLQFLGVRHTRPLAIGLLALLVLFLLAQFLRPPNR